MRTGTQQKRKEKGPLVNLTGRGEWDERVGKPKYIGKELGNFLSHKERSRNLREISDKGTLWKDHLKSHSVKSLPSSIVVP